MKKRKIIEPINLKITDEGIGRNRIILTNCYLNNYNFFNKSTIKLQKFRKKKYQEIKLNTERLKKENALPKLLIPSKFTRSSSNKEFINNHKDFGLKKIDNKSERNISKIKNKTLENIDLYNTKKIINFDEIKNFIENIKIDDELEKEQNDNDLEENKSEDKKDINKSTQISQKSDEKKENSEVNNKTSFENRNNFYITSTKENIENSQKVLNEEEEEVEKVISINSPRYILNTERNYKNLLSFNNYGKYKFTEPGVFYPNNLSDNYLPEYRGEDKSGKELYNYHRDISNPNKIYLHIGSFNNKLNNDLGIISSNYGSQLSKGRFVYNPLLTKFLKKSPNYEQYKNVKTVENKYLNKNRYKFKLMPLIPKKKSNFDVLAKKIFQMKNNKS